MILIWSYHFLADEQCPSREGRELLARVGTCLLSCGSSGQKEKASGVICDENWTCTEPAVRCRILDRTGQNGDATEDTRRHGKPTGMMA